MPICKDWPWRRPPTSTRPRGVYSMALEMKFCNSRRSSERSDSTGSEPGNVEQRAEDLLDRLQRVVDVLDQARILAAVLALDEARHIKPRRVERLQDVVAGGGEKPGFRDAGVFGGALGQSQLGIQPGQFLGAVAHAFFQCRV